MNGSSLLPAEPAQRRIRMLRTAMGPEIAAALEDPEVAEVLLPLCESFSTSAEISMPVSSISASAAASASPHMTKEVAPLISLMPTDQSLRSPP